MKLAGINRGLFVLAVVGWVASSANAGLVGWWRIEEGTGSTIIDHSGLDNPATLTGTASWTNDVERGQVLKINGNGDARVYATYSMISTSMTVCFWVKGDASPLRSAPFSAFRNGTRRLRTYVPYTDAGTDVRLDTSVGNPSFSTASTNISGRWVHWAFVMNAAANTYQVYIDSVLASSGAIGGTFSMNDINRLYLGSNEGLNDYDGLVDDYQLFNHPLTSNEVYNVFNPPNIAPTAVNDDYLVASNVLRTVDAPGVLGNDYDLDNDPMVVSLVSGSAHGTLNLSSNGSFTYMPVANYVGPDSFTYRVTDGQGGTSLVTTVSLDVQAIELFTTQELASFQADLGVTLTIDEQLTLAPIVKPTTTPSWRANANTRISTNRKAVMTVNVVDGAGQPLPGALVTADLSRKQFKFGGILDAKQFAGDEPMPLTTNQYQSISTNLFDAVGLNNALKYKLDGLHQYLPGWFGWCSNANLKSRGHLLMWPGGAHMSYTQDLHVLNCQTNTNPAQVAAASNALRATVKSEIAGWAAKWPVSEWDVLNEPINNFDVQDILGYQEEATWHWLAYSNKVRPDCEIGINEYQLASALDDATFNRRSTGLAWHVKNVLTNGAPLDFAGFQSRYKVDVPMSTVYSRLQTMNTLLGGIDLVGTEFEIQSLDTFQPDEVKRAEMTENLMTMYYSYPTMRGLYAWDFAGGNESSLMDVNGDYKMNALVWYYLNRIRYNTDSNLVTNLGGAGTVNGHKGDYKLKATYGGYTNTATYTLSSNGTVTIMLSNFFLNGWAFYVNSQHGQVDPPVGSNSVLQGWTITNRAFASVNGYTQYTPSGWTMTGHEPQSGSGNSFVMTVTNNGAALTWLWTTGYLAFTTNAYSSTDDASVRNNSTANYGSDPTMSVRSFGYAPSFLKFNVAGNIVWSNVGSVVLRMRSASFIYETQVYGTSNAWTELTVHGSNEPDSNIGTRWANDSNLPSETWLDFDVTAYVISNGTYSFALRSSQTNDSAWYTKESAFAPQLLVSELSPSRTLTVVSQHGSPSPAVGSFQYGDESVVNASVQNVEIQNTQYIASGFTIAGNSPAAGSTNAVSITLTNNATLTWLWTTNISPFIPARTSAVEDAHIINNDPANYGSDSIMEVRSSGYNPMYMKFTVAGVAWSNVGNVKLRFKTAGAFDVLDVRITSNAWDEATINGTNEPDNNLTKLAEATNLAAETWYELDVSTYVTSDGTYSFAFRNSSPSTGKVYSSESAFAPELVVNAYAAPRSIQVVSEWGSTTPTPDPVGTHTYGLGEAFSNRIATYSVGSTQYLSAGFTLTGHDAGMTDSNKYVVFTVTNNAVLTWRWITNITTGTRALMVTSDHGVTVPPAGSNTVNLGATITNQAPSQLVGNTQYVATGWTMTGHDPATGSGNSFVMTVTNDAALTWHWATNVVSLTANIFNPTEDAWVQNNSTINHGTETLLTIRSSGFKPAFMKFNVTGINWSNVNSVVLRMRTSTTMYDLEVWTTSNAWTELTVHGSNEPDSNIGTRFVQTGSVTSAPETWMEFNPASVVNSNGLYSFALRKTSANDASFYSREGTFPPELIVYTYGTPVNLQVVSEHGTPTPSVGLHGYGSGTLINPGVNEYVENQNTQRVCAGWTLSGNDPQSGGTNSFGTFLTNDAVLTWLWTTNVSDVIPRRTLAQEDAFTINNTTNNYGNDSLLTIRSFGFKPAFLKFAVTNVNWANVESVKLRMNAASAVDQTEVFLTSNDWSELTVNGTNEPDSNAGPKLDEISNVVAGTWNELDVGGVVTSNGTYSFAIRNSSGNDGSWYSSEGLKPPELVFYEYANPAVLTIVSQHGAPVPNGVGAHIFNKGSVVSNRAPSVTVGSTQYVATGFTLSGNTPGSGSTNYVVFTITNSATLTWQWTTNVLGVSRSIVVVSERGSPHLPVGTNSVNDGSVITNRMPYVLAGYTQFVASGWSMTGNSPASGAGASFVMTVTNDAVLTWQWATNYVGFRRLASAPVEDAYVQNNDVANYGTETLLTIKSSGFKPAFLKFNVAGINWTNVASVQLRLRSATALESTEIRSTSNAWSELTVNGTNEPDWNASGAWDSKTNMSANTWYDFNVAGVISSDGTYTLVLRSSTTNDHSWYSRESGYPPELVIREFAAPANFTIVSEHGSPTPAVGSTIEGSGSVLTNIAASFQIQNTQYVVAGWSMAGNNPVSGVADNFSMTITNSATLTWLWTTNVLPLIPQSFTSAGDAYVINNNANNFGTDSLLTIKSFGFKPAFLLFNVAGVAWTNVESVKLRMRSATAVENTQVYGTSNAWTELTVNGTNEPDSSNGTRYDERSNLVAETWYEFDVSDYVNADGTWSLAIRNTSTNDHSWYSRDSAYPPELLVSTYASPRSLTVASQRGNPTPAIGYNVFGLGDVVTAKVNNVTVGSTQYIVAGWSLVGQAPASGTTNTVVITMTNNATLTWLWSTNVMASSNVLTVVSEHGSPVPAVGANAYSSGTVVSNSVAPVTVGSTQYLVTGWTVVGNDPVSGTTNWFQLTLTNDSTVTWLWTTNILGVYPTNYAPVVTWSRTGGVVSANFGTNALPDWAQWSTNVYTWNSGDVSPVTNSPWLDTNAIIRIRTFRFIWNP